MSDKFIEFSDEEIAMMTPEQKKIWEKYAKDAIKLIDTKIAEIKLNQQKHQNNEKTR
jgi:hypothetical protein